MSRISTEIACHDEYRVIPCVLCASHWEERLVGVAMTQNQSLVGNLCPRCLNLSPADNAAWLRAYATHFQAAMQQLNETLQPAALPLTVEKQKIAMMRVMRSTAQLRELTTLLRRGKAELAARTAAARVQFQATRATFLRLQELSEKSENVIDRQFAGMLGHETLRTERSLSLIQDLLEIEEWPTSLTDVKRIEIERLTARFNLRANVHDVVENRYRKFLLRL